MIRGRWIRLAASVFSVLLAAVAAGCGATGMVQGAGTIQGTGTVTPTGSTGANPFGFY
jgi:hypothetical protein